MQAGVGVIRTVFLSATAMAGGLALAGAAFAEAPKVTFSGSTDYYLRGTDYDAPAGVSARQNGPGWDINQQADASELIWDARATAENGLQFGANIQLRYAGNVTTDESWIDFAGAWGRIVLGDDDGVVDNLEVSGDSVLPLGAYDTARFTGAIASPAGFQSGSAAAGVVGESADASKIAYYTPRFAGFAAAVSVTPDTGSTFGSNNTGAVGAYGNVVESALTYTNQLGEFGVKLSVGYVAGDSFATGGASRQDVGSLQAGGSLSYAGVTFGAAYGDSGESGCLTSVANCDQGKLFNAGLSYRIGPANLGIGYATTYDADIDGNGIHDEAEYYSVEGSYAITPGLTGYGGVMRAERKDGDAAQHIDSTIFVLGTRVNF